MIVSLCCETDSLEMTLGPDMGSNRRVGIVRVPLEWLQSEKVLDQNVGPRYRGCGRRRVD